MTLKEQIDSEIKNAMLSKKKDDLRALRAIKSLILLAETEKGGSTGIDEGSEIRLLTKAAKQRRDSLEIYRNQGREDLAVKEEEELKIIEKFLPKQLTDDEISSEIKQIIQELGAGGPQDMGRVMGASTKKLAGKADGKKIAEIAKKLLS